MSDKSDKEIVKEALKEWLDEKFTEFGKWTFYSLAALSLTALIYFILKSNGWSIARTPLSH